MRSWLSIMAAHALAAALLLLGALVGYGYARATERGDCGTDEPVALYAEERI